MRVDTMAAALLLLLSFTFAITNVTAAEKTNTSNTPVDTPPDAETLEFIAGFVTVDGEWIDPMHFYDTFETDNNAKEKDNE
jgi:hypothetical protein